MTEQKLPEARWIDMDDNVHCRREGCDVVMSVPEFDRLRIDGLRYREWRCCKCGRRDHTKYNTRGPNPT
jgi:hypothetical protein